MRLSWLAAPLVLLSSAAALADPPAPTLYMAGDDGVREIGLDAKVVRTLTKVPSRWPRRLDDKNLVVVRPVTREIVAVALADGRERVLARLPESANACKTDDTEAHVWPVTELGVQSDGDFVVDGGGAKLCLSLKDRNENMVDVDLGVRVDVKTGAVTTALNFPKCGGAALPACTAPAAPSVPTGSGAFDVAGGWLVERNPAQPKTPKKVALLGKDFTTELASPNGHWLVISGNIDGGDYVHRSLYLLDSKSGAVWTMGPKPKAVAKAKLKNLKLESIDAVGETSMRWLDDGTVLLVDSTLVTPGKGTVDLGPGDVMP